MTRSSAEFPSTFSWDTLQKLSRLAARLNASKSVFSQKYDDLQPENIFFQIRKLDCHSILHYMDVPFNNCILNVHSRQTRSEYFLPELHMKVDYVEVPTCVVKMSEQQIDGKRRR